MGVAISYEVLELVSRRMQLLSGPLRIWLVLALGDGEACLQELADKLETERRNASRGLNALYRGGLLARDGEES